MIIELGHFALALSLAVAVAQAVLPLWGLRTGEMRLVRVARPAAIALLLLLTLSFAALTYAYVISDFSVENVWANSHTLKPLLYKISGVWGNHEGSMLLWVLILALFGAAVALFGVNLPDLLRGTVLAIQGLIAVAFLLFVLLTSNPFLRIPNAPLEGRGLNPILQDPALAFHPPFLYAGYVGFSMAFSFAVAALLLGRIDAAWARWVRPWTLAAWIFLTLGIAMGSWWAYYELGWGGWWFWDPVENASFMPWLAGTALLHSALVMEKREALKVWTVLLAMITFSLSLMGTFLVRSGILSSVHAFAVDPQRGVFILGIMVLTIGGSLGLFALRASALRQGGQFAPVSREGALVLNNILLTVGMATVLVGTLYPLALEMISGTRISVGAPFFNLTFVPLMVPLLVAVPFGPLLAWKRGDMRAAAELLLPAIVLSTVGAAITLALNSRGPWLAPFAFAIGVWVIAGAVTEIASRIRLGRVEAAEAVRRAAGLPRSAWGTATAHIGLGMMVLGIVGTSAWQQEVVSTLSPGGEAKLAGYTVRFKGIEVRNGPNYREQIGLVEVLSGGRLITRLEPSKRLYEAPRQSTTEAGIYNAWGGDLYVVLGDEAKEGAFAFRVYFNPLVRLIWIGALVMSLGGLLSLTDRRLRVGAPRPARSRRAAAPAE